MPLRLPRRIRRWLAGWLAATLLVAPWLTAAHACAMGASLLAMAAAAADGDDSAPSTPICAEHCKSSAQAPDATGHAPTAGVPALLTGFVLVPQDTLAALPGDALRRAAPHAQSPPPTLAVLHCCWRI